MNTEMHILNHENDAWTIYQSQYPPAEKKAFIEGYRQGESRMRESRDQHVKDNIIFRDRAEKCLNLLRRLEWSNRVINSDCCPICYRADYEGHSNSCALAAAISE